MVFGYGFLPDGCELTSYYCGQDNNETVLIKKVNATKRRLGNFITLRCTSNFKVKITPTSPTNQFLYEVMMREARRSLHTPAYGRCIALQYRTTHSTALITHTHQTHDHTVSVGL